MSTALDGTKKMALRSSLETMAGEVLDRNVRIAALEAALKPIVETAAVIFDDTKYVRVSRELVGKASLVLRSLEQQEREK